MIYLTTSSDASSYFPGYDISIQADNQALLRYVPATGNVVLLGTNYSPSYATSTLRPFTAEGRFFTTIDYSTQGTLYSRSLADNSQTSSLFFSGGIPDCLAIVNDTVFFRHSTTHDLMKLVGFTSATSASAATIVRTYVADPSNCYFNLAGANGHLLDVQFFPSISAPTDFFIYERDQTTGATTLKGSLHEASPASYTSNLVAFDGSYFYLVRKVIAGSKIEVWRYNWTLGVAAGNDPVLTATLIPTAAFTGPVVLDVHSGYLAMLVYDVAPSLNVRLLIYDDNTTTFTKDTVVGRDYYDVEVLYLP